MQRLRKVSDAKIRVSYGSTGNNRVSDFGYLSTLNTASGLYYSFNEQNLYGITASTLGNKKLKWETTNQLDLGLDFYLFNSKLSVELDYYKKITKDLLLAAQSPLYSGYTSVFRNIGKLSNEGFEMSLTLNTYEKKNFRWITTMNISFNRNRVLELIDNQEAIVTSRQVNAGFTTPDYITKIGKPVAQFYGLISDGNYQLSDFYKIPNGSTGVLYVLKENIPYYASKNSLANPNTNQALVVQPGDPKFKDLNGDGIIANTSQDLTDFTVTGSPYPIHFGGLSNNFIYKNFDLNVFFQWSYGAQIYNANRMIFEGGASAPQSGGTITGANAGNINNNMFATYANRWTLTNPSNDYYRVNAQTGGTRQYSSRVVEDGSYLRLKTVSLGYSLSSKLIRKLSFSSLRFALSAQNLLTFTKYTGPDPEVSTFSGNNLTPGFDFSPYPRTRTITFVLNALF